MADEDKDYAKSPLLFVEQSGIDEPRARMQGRYRSYGKKKTTRQQQQNQVDVASQENKQQTEPPAAKKSIKRTPVWKNALNQQDTSEMPEDTASQTPENSEAGQSMADEKPFKDMTIEEKVTYLTNRPGHAPVLRCEVTTDERSYRGVIVETKDNEIFMRIGRRTSTTAISVANITNIRLLGLM